MLKNKARFDHMTNPTSEDFQSATHHPNEGAHEEDREYSLFPGWPKRDWDAIIYRALQKRDEAIWQEQIEASKPRGGIFIIRIKNYTLVQEENGEESCLFDSDYLTDVEEIYASKVEFCEYVKENSTPIGVKLYHGNGKTRGDYDAPGFFIMKPGDKVTYETNGTMEEDHVVLPYHSSYEIELFGWSDELFEQCFRVL